MKILVTGYKGFIGQNMVEQLLADGHRIVKYEWGEELPGPTEWFGVDWCIHLGAISSTTCTDTHKLLWQNYIFTKWLVSKCESLNIPVQIASSASVYGTDNTTFVETDTPAPKNHYAWSKFLMEEYLMNKEWKIPVQIFRYFNVFGPYEDHKGDQASPVHKFRQQAMKDGVIRVFERSDEYTRDFIHVHDIIDYHKKFWNVKKPGAQIYNLGTGKATSFMNIALGIKNEIPCTIQEIRMPEELEQSYQKFTKADMTKTLKALNEA